MPKIELETFINAPLDRCFNLSRSIDLHKNSLSHTKEEAIGGVVSGLIDAGDHVCWKANHFGLSLQLCSLITVCKKPSHFADEMKSGPFHSFRHDHFFDEANGLTIMKDTFVYKSPLGVLGRLADRLFLKKYMTKLLITRNEHLKAVAESDQWKNLLSVKKKVV